MIAYLFSRATNEAARNVKHILDHYYNVSGQFVNYYKSKIQFFKGITKAPKVEIYILYTPNDHWYLSGMFNYQQEKE